VHDQPQESPLRRDSTRGNLIVRLFFERSRTRLLVDSPDSGIAPPSPQQRRAPREPFSACGPATAGEMALVGRFAGAPRMERYVILSILTVLVVLPFVPSASACLNGCQPLVGACVAGVTAPQCYPGGNVCVYGFDWAPLCATVPVGVSSTAASASAQCSESVLTNGAAIFCTVNGVTVGHAATCGACILWRVHFTCTEGTRGVGCTPLVP
jgi:hypothetical protein